MTENRMNSPALYVELGKNVFDNCVTSCGASAYSGLHAYGWGIQWNCISGIGSEIYTNLEQQSTENFNRFYCYPISINILLVNSILALLIIFDRRRIGNIKFLKIGYHHSNFMDFEAALMETEER